jgi:hypothetical protein
MTLDLVLPPDPGDRAHPAGAGPAPWLALVPPLAAPAAQQEFLTERDRLLPRAAASGERSTTALYLILAAHDAELPSAGAGHALCCVTCVRPGGAARAPYPCPTAEQALWALAALLS